MAPIVSDLDDLFAESLQAGRDAGVFRTVKNATPAARKSEIIKPQERYVLPEFWLKGRVIALIHEPSKTLLGNFQEFNHKHDKYARKLERIDGPAQVTCQEHVTGKWWLGDTREEFLIQPERWEVEREITLEDLLLQQMGVHSELVEVKVCLQYGGIARVELLNHTTFHSPEAKIVLTIPAGTNVLECMSLDAKIQLRKELQ